MLKGANQLTPTARRAMMSATTIYLSPISVFEITQKVRIGKWPAMAPIVPHLAACILIQGIVIVPVDVEICALAGTMASQHRDPFDRIVAATALRLSCPVVSSDAVFDTIVTRIW